MTQNKKYPMHSDQQKLEILALNRDITGHQEVERLLRADVAHKDILLEEISHRVLNSFHLVASMLQLQARRSPNKEVKQQLEIAAQRVFSMASLHKRLYDSANNIETVNAKIYLNGLCEELRDGFFSDDRNYTLSLDSVADLDLPTDTMAVIGLAVSELVTNACKYAYKKDEQGVVSVALARSNGAYRLSVNDSGVGLPAGFNIDGANGLGMSIVKVQVKELGGTLEIDRTPPGTGFIIHIPE